jgi:hypothetical protein
MFVHRLIIVGCLMALAVLTAGFVFAETIQVQKEVRITARLLETGKVEFGLQERTDGGEWGETLLPRVNKFPYATAAVDDWLFSSPVALTPVEYETAEEGMGQVEDPEITTEPDVGFGRWEDQSYSGARGDTVLFGLYDEESVGQLGLTCTTDGRAGVLVVTDEYLLNDRGTDRITVYYRFEGGQTQSARWFSTESVRSSGVGTFAEVRSFARFLSFGATQSTTFYFSVTDRYGDSYHGTFDVTGIHAVLEALPCLSVTG